MLTNNAANKRVIRKIAVALGDMNEKVVFVGGAAVSLYINDPAAEDARPTKDVDIGLEIASFGELENIREELTEKGFSQSPEDDVICRFRYEGIKVDVMGAQEVGWAPANPWFGPGFKEKEKVEVEGQKIHVLPMAYFLASKLTAFRNRGSEDPRTSHDFEDIVFVLDNCTDIIDPIIKASDDVKLFLKDEFQGILDDFTMQEAIRGNLNFEMREDRFQRIIDGMKEISGHIDGDQ